jgi:2'-5' RNA ligase
VKVNLLRPDLPPRQPKVYAFVAVHFDDDLLDDVAALAERLRGDARLSGLTWSEPYALRATLHFFLNTTESIRARLAELVEELATTASSHVPAPRVRASRLHGFPTAESAHFVVLDLEDVGSVPYLSALQARAEAEAVALGAQPSTRLMAPYLKLGRASTPIDVSPFHDEAKLLSPGRVSAISLYVSSAVQDADVHNRYDRVLTVPLRADP